MPIKKTLIKKLDDLGVKYDIVSHRKVFTAYDAAQTMKKKVDEIVKSLLVKAGGTYYLIHVPASKNIDLKKLATTLDVKKVTFPSEKVVTNALKIKPGSLTAFGFAHKVQTVVDKSLTKAKKVIFSSGSLTESIEMNIKEFLKTDEIKLGSFAVAKKLPKISARNAKRSAAGGKKAKAKPKKKTTPKKKVAPKKKK
jgi:prolyl-tRNA editing enzyme YbaK/EbsC (Cys-tRNA(Pro) deacylase)